MSQHRWSKFWWQDWQADQALRSCGVAARGLWMDMLCIAHNGTPRGHVTINGQAVTPKRLATLAGVSERECVRLLHELEIAGVFSKTDDGVIFSRRMVRDTSDSNEGRQAIEKRWNRSADPNRVPITPPNRGAMHDPITLEAEAEADIERTPLTRGSAQRAAARPAHVQNGLRLPEGWLPQDPDFEGATRQTLATFRDYWAAQPGAKGRKADWEATWRNWCRRDAEQRKRAPPKTSAMTTTDQNDELIRLTRETDLPMMRLIG